MAVNKNFVVKNGLEVNTQLILADANTNKVGIGSTGPRFELDVAGGIGATDLYVSGISTVFSEFNVGTDGTVLTVLGIGGSVGVGTALPEYLLDIRSPVSTGQTALYVQGDLRVTGDLSIDDINLDQANVNRLYVAQNLDIVNPATLYVESGISTFGGYLDANSDVDISGTLNVGGATTVGGYLDANSDSDFSGTVNISGITTIGGYTDINSDLDVSGTVNISGITTIGGYTDINSDLDVSGTINVGGATTIGGYLDINSDADINGTLNVSGISTLGSVLITSGIVTATSPSGIVTYYGDGSELLGVIGGIGIGTTGGTVGYGITFLNFFGAGVSTTQYESSVGVATIFFEGGGGGGSISISTVAPTSPGSGDLWYSPDYGRTFIYYDETVVGYGTDAYWVDAAPFNTGVLPVTGVGIQSTGTLVGSGVTILNFVGTGNTFAVVGDRVDISIAGGVGIQSAGSIISPSGVTQLNFVGAGNTFAVDGNRVDISIQGGGGGSIGTTGITTQTFFSNPNIITEPYTLDNPDHNYGMFGPVSIGATISVGAGNTFVIV